MRKIIVFNIFLILLSVEIFSSESENIFVRDIDEFYVGKNLTELEIYPPDFYASHEDEILVGNFLFPYVRVLSNDVIYDVCYDWNYLIRDISLDEDSKNDFSKRTGKKIYFEANNRLKILQPEIISILIICIFLMK